MGTEKATTVIRERGMEESIETVWLGLGVDPKTGMEGIAAEVRIGTGFWPIVEVNESHLPALLERCERISKASGTEVRVVKLMKRELVATFGAKPLQ